MADTTFWEILYGTLLTEERAEALQRGFEEALLKQIEVWVQEILDGIKKEILQKAQTGNFTIVGRTRCIEGEYGGLCGDFAYDSAFHAIFLEMEKSALLNRYCELRCTELPDGGKRLYFDAACRSGSRSCRLGQFGAVFSQRIKELCAEDWIKIGVMPPRTSKRDAEKRERTELRIYYTVSL